MYLFFVAPLSETNSLQLPKTPWNVDGDNSLDEAPKDKESIGHGACIRSLTLILLTINDLFTSYMCEAST